MGRHIVVFYIGSVVIITIHTYTHGIFPSMACLPAMVGKYVGDNNSTGRSYCGWSYIYMYPPIIPWSYIYMLIIFNITLLPYIYLFHFEVALALIVPYPREITPTLFCKNFRGLGV